MENIPASRRTKRLERLNQRLSQYPLGQGVRDTASIACIASYDTASALRYVELAIASSKSARQKKGQKKG
jgi:hypothetical protein